MASRSNKHYQTGQGHEISKLIIAQYTDLCFRARAANLLRGFLLFNLLLAREPREKAHTLI
jgi:hypothetical protein